RATKRERAVEVGVIVVAARVGLESDAKRLPLFAQRVERRSVGLRAEERAIQAEATLEDRRGPAESAAREAGRDDTGVCGPSRMDSLHPRPVLEVLVDSRGEAAGDAERDPRADRRQASCRTFRTLPSRE